MQMTSGVIEASVGGAGFTSIPPPGFELPGLPVLVTSNLASNPGDYAWGRGGLDAIITQLMNQLDGTGPPPLNKTQIQQIPKASITKEQCGKLQLLMYLKSLGIYYFALTRVALTRVPC